MFLLKLAKYKAIRKASAFIISFSCLVLFAVGLCSLEAKTNGFMQNEIASEISETALRDEYEYAYLGFTIDGCQSSPDFTEIFQISRNLNLQNFNRTGYSIQTVFDANTSNSFSKTHEYKIENEPIVSLVGDNPISLLPSPLNYINNYIHEIWKLKMLFDERNLSINVSHDNFCFIPESWALALLRQQGIESPTNEQIHSVIGKSIDISYINKTSLKTIDLSWTISNVFLEDETFESLYRQYGLFLPCYIAALPSYEYPSVVVQFGKSVYTNKYYLGKINEYFGARLEESFFVLDELKSNNHLDLQKLTDSLKSFNDLGMDDKRFYIISTLAAFILLLINVFAITTQNPLTQISYILISSFAYIIAKLIIFLLFGIAPGAFTTSSIIFFVTVIAIVLVDYVLKHSLFYKSKGYGFKTDFYRI